MKDESVFYYILGFSLGTVLEYLVPSKSNMEVALFIGFFIVTLMLVNSIIAYIMDR